MRARHKILSLGVVAAFTLGACTDPASLGGGTTTDNPNQNRNRGAAIGAGAGALLGTLLRDDDRLEGAAIGGVVGAAIGGGIGYSLDQQAADLRQQIGNDDVVITNTGDRLIVTLPQDILFPVNGFTVRSDLRGDLQALAQNLQQYPQSNVQIVGHTDSDGDASSNLQLSERRANAVADVLLESGIPFSRMQTFGRGEDQPVATNLTLEGKSQNRRVEIVILPTA
ncbi:MAG: OmpA family protein [Paracoccaceae bacterium]